MLLSASTSLHVPLASMQLQAAAGLPERQRGGCKPREFGMNTPHCGSDTQCLPAMLSLGWHHRWTSPVLAHVHSAQNEPAVMARASSSWHNYLFGWQRSCKPRQLVHLVQMALIRRLLVTPKRLTWHHKPSFGKAGILSAACSGDLSTAVSSSEDRTGRTLRVTGAPRSTTSLRMPGREKVVVECVSE